MTKLSGWLRYWVVDHIVVMVIITSEGDGNDSYNDGGRITVLFVLLMVMWTVGYYCEHSVCQTHQQLFLPLALVEDYLSKPSLLFFSFPRRTFPRHPPCSLRTLPDEYEATSEESRLEYISVQESLICRRKATLVLYEIEILA